MNTPPGPASRTETRESERLLDEITHIKPRKEPTNAREREERLLAAICRRPGSHLRQLHRATKIALGTTARTLTRLEEDETILAEEIDAYKRYFPKEGIHRRERIVLAHVASDKPRRILHTVLEEPGIGHKELHERVGIPGPTLSYYLARLERDQVVLARERKNRRFFRVKNPELVTRALERWRDD